MTQALVKISNQGDLAKMLEGNAPKFAKVLGDRLSPEHFIQVALNAVQRDPGLWQAVTADGGDSLLKVLNDASNLGLEPCGAWGVHLHTRGNRVTGKRSVVGIIDYRALMDLARESGKVRTFDAVIRYEGEEFKLRGGTNPGIDHVPNPDGVRNRDAIRGVYATAKLDTGETQWVYLKRDEIEAVKNRASARDKGPWGTDYEAMAKKTAIRRLCTFLPRSPKLAKGLAYEPYEGNGDDSIDLSTTASSMVNPAPKMEVPKKKGGRPLGSKNKPKVKVPSRPPPPPVPPPPEPKETEFETTQGDILQQGGGISEKERLEAEIEDVVDAIRKLNVNVADPAVSHLSIDDLHKRLEEYKRIYKRNKNPKDDF